MSSVVHHSVSLHYPARIGVGCCQLRYVHDWTRRRRSSMPILAAVGSRRAVPVRAAAAEVCHANNYGTAAPYCSTAPPLLQLHPTAA
jgi:hypothetical protein